MSTRAPSVDDYVKHVKSSIATVRGGRKIPEYEQQTIIRDVVASVWACATSDLDEAEQTDLRDRLRGLVPRLRLKITTEEAS